MVINGVGVKKLVNYGDVFLEVIVGVVFEVYLCCCKFVGWFEGLIYDWFLVV